MPNNASLRGRNSDLTVHHSQARDYTVIYKQSMVGQFATALLETEGMHMCSGEQLCNTENQTFKHEGDKDGSARTELFKPLQ